MLAVKINILYREYTYHLLLVIDTGRNLIIESYTLLSIRIYHITFIATETFLINAPTFLFLIRHSAARRTPHSLNGFCGGFLSEIDSHADEKIGFN